MQSDVQRAVEGLYRENLHSNVQGELASYIPELASVNPDLFAISVATVDGEVYSIGDTEASFTLQSMSKPLIYAMALELLGEEHLAEAVDTEPTGDSFNSVFTLCREGRLCNPMVNAGAIAVTDLLLRRFGKETTACVLDFVSRCAGTPLDIDAEVFRSECQTGFKNRAIACLLKTEGLVESDTEELVETYFAHCSIRARVEDVARMAATFAHAGRQPSSRKSVLSERHVPGILSVLLSCGMYDASGRWIYQVGAPAKSGVSGGIFMVVPGQMGVAVYSPRLDAKGNSVRGARVCEALSDQLDLHVFKRQKREAQ